jgi:hypothetical protein
MSTVTSLNSGIQLALLCGFLSLVGIAIFYIVRLVKGGGGCSGWGIFSPIPAFFGVTCNPADNCTATLNTNDVCTHDCQCIGGACGRPTASDADDKKLVCCATGHRSNVNLKDYCTGMPDGSQCWTDNQCANGYCGGNIGITTRGICGSKLPDGSKCEVNKNCDHGACGRPSASDADRDTLICCPSHNYTTVDAKDYCTGVPDNGVCWTDAQCASGYCGGNFGISSTGICGKNIPTGKPCKSNAGCATKACGRPTASDADENKLVCCPTSKISTVGFKDYCEGMPEGAQCWTDAQCSTNYCKGSVGISTKGVCTRK